MARIDTLQNFLADIADKLREKLSITSKIIHAEYDAKIDDVYDAGKMAEYERFWDSSLSNGNRTSFNYGFSGMSWNDDTLNVPAKYLPLTATSAEFMFRYCKATNIPSVDFTGCETLDNTYAYATVAVTIGTVILKADGTNKFATAFNRCDELQNITFEGVIGTSINFARSSKLTSASVDNIIEHLKDLTAETAQTITLHSTVGRKLTDTQKSNFQSKNWNVVY